MDSSQRLREMLSFVRAAEHGSFAEAARRLGLSSAAVGKNVSGLEAALGVRLMNRTTRSLRLTSEGEVFLVKAREAIDAIDAAIDSVSAQRTEIAGKVRISTSGGFGRHFLLPLLPKLMDRFPAVIPDIVFDDRQIDLVRDGFDLAFRGGAIEDSSLISRTICRMQMVLVAFPTYIARYGVPGRPSDLARHRLIAVRFLHGRTSGWEFDGDEDARRGSVPNASALIVSDPEAAMIAAIDGFGIAQVGLHYAWPHIRDGRLKVMLAGQLKSGTREMVLLYPHRAFIAERVRAMVDFLQQELAKVESLQVTMGQLDAYRA